MMKYVSQYVLLAITLSSMLSDNARADDVPKELAPLQGTWRLVEYENSSGKHTQQKESLWVFSGAKLYKKSTVIENVYDVRVVPKSDPKLLEMKQRPHFGEPDFAIYKFVGEQLVVAQSRSVGKHPEGFVPKSAFDESGVVGFVLTLKRIDLKANIPAEMLKRFEDVPIQRTKNREAESALLQFMAAIYKREPINVIEPLVASGKAKQLLKVTADRPAVAPEKVEDDLKKLTARDAEVGQKVKNLSGELFRVEEHHFGPDKILLISQEQGVDREAFLLRREGGHWKVDVTEMILLKQSKDLGLFGGILLGMKSRQVRDLVETYKTSQQLKSYALIKSTDTELVVDWKEKDDVVRHFFTFSGGKLDRYTSEPLVR